MSRIITCLKCHARLHVPDRVTEPTLLCPRCLGQVDNPVAGLKPSVLSLDTDVRRELNLGGIVLGVLIGLCVLGVGLSLLLKRSAGNGAVGGVLLMMVCFLALDVLVSVACIMATWRLGMAGVRTPSAGRVLGLVLLSFGLVVAVVIFFFVTCFALLNAR